MDLTKPVAWMSDESFEVSTLNIGRFSIPLYIHPVKELTDEEIHKIWMGDEFTEEWTDGSISTIHYNKFARAILRKAQEKC